MLGVLELYERHVHGLSRLAIGWLVLFGLLFAGCCLASRRLHDLGRAGWWTGAVYILFLIAWPEPAGVVGWAARALLAVVALGLGLTPGQGAPNRFGATL